MFSGTQEKCATCGKTAYPLEKVGPFLENRLGFKFSTRWLLHSPWSPEHLI